MAEAEFDFSAASEERLRAFSRSLPMNLMVAREAVMRGFRRMLAGHDLNEQQWRVVRVLNEHSAVEVGALAQMTFLLGPSLTRILHRLEARGLIERTVAEEDRRRVNVAITLAGRALFAEVVPDSQAEYRRLEREIGQQKLDDLVDLLQDITDQVNRMDGGE